MWQKVTATHEDIDEIIVQIDYITSMQDDEVFNEMRNTVNKIRLKKAFLDSLRILISEADFQAYMELYSFPNALK